MFPLFETFNDSIHIFGNIFGIEVLQLYETSVCNNILKIDNPNTGIIKEIQLYPWVSLYPTTIIRSKSFSHLFYNNESVFFEKPSYRHERRDDE